MPPNISVITEQLSSLRTEIYTTIAELTLHAAELRKWVEMLERRNREGASPQTK